MPWNESTRSPRPISPAYLPPHLRHQPTFTVTIPTSLARSSSSRGGGGGGRGRGRGRGFRGGRAPNPPRSYGRSRRNFSDYDPNPYNQKIMPEPPFDISEKFDELEVIDDDPSGVNNINAYDETPVETSGFDVPPPVTSFSEIDFCSGLSDNIKRCQFVKPTPIQRYAIPVAMAGRDLMACAQTGSGKTAAFCFPIITRILRDHHQLKSPTKKIDRNGGGGGFSLKTIMACPLALILAPTRELSCQIHDEAKKFSYKTGVKVVVAYGGAPIVQQFRNLEKGVDILVATPGRLVDMIERAKVSLKNVKYLALDEADRMLDMGFEPQVRKIVQQMEMPPAGVRQTMLFSATFPIEIQRLASDFLSNYIFLAAGKVGSSTDLIAQRVEYVHDADKKNHLLNLLRSQRANGKHALTLVFVETKKGADALQSWLSMKGFPSMAIHGDKVQMERERALKSFRSGLTPILVATDVAARGLDIPHVAHVINFDLPREIGDYVHRIGRTGRAGKPGLATAFFSDKNAPLAKALVELMQEANQEIPPWLNEYTETSHAYGSGGTRSSRFSGVKFGGHNYRRGADNENYDYSNQFEDGTALESYPSHSSPYSSHDSRADFPTSSRADSFHEGFYGHMLDHRTVVASGWD
ncbi:DEAD-box ATP-dependent RNA helicase 52C-like [Coffea eugenioides]|uniref:RNA helicase n=1 Tax=Coffea arabica TaxID=13443 RepID=A0A6P6SXK3_COFAR|nr:DEAD-box ATP-dependent RNA helicase 52C-like [Coffea arabica]XP_027065584.1 DEAD-box ATP-dependent RNA helicase 52C-like [Coffea arabica]XP_027070782.1 DEAD-box ATP-dependent RNA helicase 52C-like [Coffea arabica]XP_027070784.1 DEAD-box ATP-dependent RNA helicase 52C-like [Coffea arabica]XP_027173816.1 DEAD-box ATP-dependent RNA helicase 52C-like [Coffea eugenioides]XP_027173817.1 DEAD-box ATP-dependent RNA helicase 52C-like [Coffea eugenioides]